MKAEKETVVPGLTVTIYDKRENKTVDIFQDKDKIVLTYDEALILASYIIMNVKKPTTTQINR